ncbi:Glycosyltransferase involved in cell wall bisynthesis [Halorientalis persicus]|uniref:Glycosyltransferase involved in cell wall bisynthesis n=1 Tax=Halorientalis persicus TaxID=1367881 RepID=A0A1H8V511_9EURY|nr:glycosyltransferase family 2 protein [Halorientalis persicus]SEP10317.1 Glycosyltransferase involved in cell wall bisynthesis [Halorientalis persicus]
MTEVKNRREDLSIPFGSREKPAVGIFTAGNDAGDIIKTILRAKRHDHHIFVCYQTDDHLESVEFAMQLDATVVEFDSGVSNPSESLTREVRKHGFPGLIYHETCTETIDFDRSVDLLKDSSEYTVSSIVQTNGSARSGIIVGIPTYNEEVGIGSVVLRAKEVASEVIIVDDGSTDNTVELAKKAGATVIQHSENQGKGAAIKTLLEEVRERTFETFVLLDGDGQHNPDEIPVVANPVLEEGADLVIGSRYLQNHNADETPTYRRIGQRVLDLLTFGPSQTRVTDSQSGFRALSPRAVDELAITTDDFGVETEMIDTASRNDLTIVEEPIEVRYEGIDGQTQHPLRHGLTVVVFVLQLVRDRHPLLFFGVPGLLFLAIGAYFGFDAVLVYQNSGRFYPAKVLVSGFATVIGSIGIFLGLVLNRISNMFERLDA